MITGISLRWSFGPNLFKCLKSIHIGHVEVEENQIWRDTFAIFKGWSVVEIVHQLQTTTDKL